MRKIISLAIAVFPIICFSQTLENKNFEWKANPGLQKVTADEATQPATIIENETQIEYIYNKDEELEKYYFNHQIIHISDANAVESFNKIYVPVSQASQLINFKARSIDKDGKVKEMLRGEMKEIDYEGHHYMSLAVDGLEKNSDLEYYYLKRNNTTSFHTENVFSEFRTRSYKFKIISPENIVVEAKSYNGLPQFSDTTINRKRILSSSLDNIVPLTEEQYCNFDANKMRIEAKIAKNLKKASGRLLTWADAGNRYYDRCRRLEKSEIKEGEKLLSKMQLKKNTEAETINAIENYIKSSYEIVDNDNEYTIDVIIKNKYSDQLGVCRLTCALLNAAGIKYEMIVTVSRQKKKFDPDFDTWNYLDDVLFYFPSQNMFLSPINFGYRGGLLPTQYFGESGLFIKEVAIGGITSAVTSTKKIPTPDQFGNRDSIHTEISFTDNFGKTEQKIVHGFFGSSAVFVRPFYFYYTEDKKKELIVNVLKSGIEDAVITNEKATNADITTSEVNNPFIISGVSKSSSLIERAGNTYLFNVGAVIGPQAQLYNEKPRQQPMDIGFLHSYVRNIQVRIPDGYTAGELSALNMNITSDETPTPSMGFVSTYTVKGNVIEINITEYYHQLTYPVSYFEEFRKVINAAADFNKIKIVFEKK